MSNQPIAIQLYTVREETAKDFIGTLKKIAEIGYTGVEFAGYGNLSAGELKKVLADLNLTVVGAHVGLDGLEKDPGSIIDYQVGINNHAVAISYFPAPPDLNGWTELAARMNAAGELCKRNDIQLCYHNHAHEFISIDGVWGLDLLYRFTDPALVKAEIDTYWVQKGNDVPASYVAKYAGRVPLLHCKDMAPGEERTFAEVGEGILDWKAIIAAARVAGVQWYIVEQDVCKRPCLESAAISFKNLQALLS